MIANSHNEPLPRRKDWWERVLLVVTLVMTYLTVAKELVLYQNDIHSWKFPIYLAASHGYYPLFLLNLSAIVWTAWNDFKRNRVSSWVVAAACVLIINVGLFSANNVINLLQGRPLHGWHHGIGW